MLKSLTLMTLFIRYVDVYTSAADNDDTEESIGLMPDENARVGIELYRSEIKSIKIID